MSSPAAESTGGRGLLPLVLAAVLLFGCTLWLDSMRNGFPFFYHPDEPGKVEQLITGNWNFHHPLLMLGTAELAKKALGLPDREQALVVLGRWCSACFSAGGVLCFALLGWRMRGWGGFLAVGLLLLTQHQVFELAHYFKEDAALFFTVGLAFLALHVLHCKPNVGAAVCAGAACGLCLSAKYLGGVMLIPAVVILAAAQHGKRGSGIQWVWFGCGFAAAVATVNFPVFAHLDLFRHSFGRETELVAKGEAGYTGGQVAIYDYIRIFVIDTTPVIWLLVIAELIARRKRRDAFEWVIAAFPFAFMALLACSTKTNDRYFLPATAGFHFLAGLGIVDLPKLLSPRWAAWLRPWRVGALAVLANVFLYPMGLAYYLDAFAHDDRTEMLAWIRANVPPNAVIAGEGRANLPVTRRPERLAVQPLLPQRTIEVRLAADLGATPAAVAAQGIDYIVVSESDYGIFFRKAAEAHLAVGLQPKRNFYEELFREYKPLWERPRGIGIYLHPGLRIYRLTAPR